MLPRYPLILLELRLPPQLSVLSHASGIFLAINSPIQATKGWPPTQGLSAILS